MEMQLGSNRVYKPPGYSLTAFVVYLPIVVQKTLTSLYGLPRGSQTLSIKNGQSRTKPALAIFLLSPTFFLKAFPGNARNRNLCQSTALCYVC